MSRLRCLEIYIDLSSGDDHDFHVLSFFMLSLSISLAHPSVLQHLAFNIRFHDPDPDLFYHKLNNIWSPLNDITFYPTTSWLQRVEVNISYLFRYDNDEEEPVMDEVSKAVLEGLPILNTRGILFVEATLGELSDDSEPSYDGHQANVW